MTVFRLVLDPPRSATLNMAIDEMLMESHSGSSTMPTLRFYSWESSSISVGYFQNVGEVARRFDCGRRQISVVRRLTGGGLVKHGEDLTFSLTMKIPHPLLPSDVKASYLKINEALMAGLKGLYPVIDFADCKTASSAKSVKERICFETPSCYDLLLEGRKVVGASQRRRGPTFLHQSSISLEASGGRLIRRIVEGFESKFGIRFQEIPLTEEELEAAEAKERERYDSPDWAFRALASSFF